MTPGPKPFTPFGRPIVAIPEIAAQTLGVPIERVTAAIEAGLEPWGRDFLGRLVFRIADLERALGRPEPPRMRGAPWRGQPIAGTKGRRGSRLEPQSGLESGPYDFEPDADAALREYRAARP